MAELFQFELVSPERQLLSDQVDRGRCTRCRRRVWRSERSCPVHLHDPSGDPEGAPGCVNSWDEYFVRGGFADVAGGGLTVLAEQAVPVGEISREQLDQAIQDAEEDVADAKDDETKQKAEMTLAQLKDVVEALKKV